MIYVVISIMVLILGAILIEYSSETIRTIAFIGTKLRYSIVGIATIVWLIYIIFLQTEVIAVDSGMLNGVNTLIILHPFVAFLVAFPNLTLSLEFLMLVQDYSVEKANDIALLRNRVVPLVIVIYTTVKILMSIVGYFIY